MASPARRVPATGQQRSYYFIQQIRPPGFFNVVKAWRINRPVPPDVLMTAGRALGRMFDSLNLCFYHENGTIWAEYHEYTSPEILDEEWVPGVSAPLDRWLRQAATHPFRINDCPPLFRINIRRSPEAVIVCMVAHHLIADWWSMNILFRTFMSHVEHLSDESGSGMRANGPLRPATAPSFLDYAARLTRETSGHHAKDARDYWSTMLGSARPLRFRRVPTGQAPERAIMRGNGTIEADTWSALLARARAMKCSPLALLTAAVLEAATELAESGEFVLGIPSINRRNGAEMRLVGNLANRIYVKSPPRVERAGSFDDLVASADAQLRQGLRYQDFCFEDLLEHWDVADPQRTIDAYGDVLFGAAGADVAGLQYINGRFGKIIDESATAALDVHADSSGMLGDFAFSAFEAGPKTITQLNIHTDVLPGRDPQEILDRLLARLTGFVTADGGPFRGPARVPGVKP